VISYRAPEQGEAAALATLARETFDDAFGALYSAEDLAVFYDEWKTTEAFAAFMADPRVRIRVADDDGALIGYCMFGLDQKLDYDPGETYAVELKQLYVRATYHGSGVSQALMDWALSEARNAQADEIILSVYSGNMRGQAFYKRQGFHKTKDTVFLVGKQVDQEYIYAKPMTG
jgi:diamine N-acetyltransferase